MSDNVTTVWVKNKLGCKFGNRQVQVNTWANGQTTGSFTISPRSEKRIHPLDRQELQKVPVPSLLESIDFEVLGEGNEMPIPISIDSSDDLKAEISHVRKKSKWTITFNPSIVLDLHDGGSSISITIGPDEIGINAISLLGGFVAGLIAGLLLCGVSPILWGGAVVVSMAGAVAAWCKCAWWKKKKQGGESKEPIKKTIK